MEEDDDEEKALEGANEEKKKGVQAFVSVHLCKSTPLKGIHQSRTDRKGGGPIRDISQIGLTSLAIDVILLVNQFLEVMA